MQVNGITNTIITISKKKPIYLVNNSKKVQVWYKRFKYKRNIKIIYASTKMRDFNTNYDPIKIYSNFEIFKSKDLISDNVNLLFE